MADFSRRVPLDELRGRGLMKGLQLEVLEQISRWPSARAHGDEACTQLIAYTDGSACMTSAWPRLAAEAGWGAVIFAVGASGDWRLAGGIWEPVETDPAAQLFLGASRPTSPVAEVTTIASVLRMLRAAHVSIPLTILSDSQYALGVVLGEDRALSEIPPVQLARSEARCHRQRAGIEGRHVAAHSGLAGNEFGGCWPQAVDGAGAGRCALADRIFWQGIKDEVDPLRPFRPGRQCLEVVELIFGSALCFPSSAVLLLELVLLP